MGRFDNVTLEDMLLLDVVGEQEFERIKRIRLRKAKRARASINKDDQK